MVEANSLNRQGIRLKFVHEKNLLKIMLFNISSAFMLDVAVILHASGFQI